MAKASAMILNYYEENAAQLTQLLEPLDVEVVSWRQSGSNWFQDYNKFNPNFMFVDLLLPERDGIYCINKLVKQKPEAICILTHPYTSYIATHTETRAFKAGAVAIVQKPIVISRFNVVMSRFLKHF